ncbi:hypothetical protein WICPIJ_004511, partial [Wickerhamomyces pijperi]
MNEPPGLTPGDPNRKGYDASYVDVNTTWAQALFPSVSGDTKEMPKLGNASRHKTAESAKATYNGRSSKGTIEPKLSKAFVKETALKETSVATYKVTDLMPTPGPGSTSLPSIYATPDRLEIAENDIFETIVESAQSTLESMSSLESLLSPENIKTLSEEINARKDSEDALKEIYTFLALKSFLLSPSSTEGTSVEDLDMVHDKLTVFETFVVNFDRLDVHTFCEQSQCTNIEAHFKTWLLNTTFINTKHNQFRIKEIDQRQQHDQLLLVELKHRVGHLNKSTGQILDMIFDTHSYEVIDEHRFITNYSLGKSRAKPLVVQYLIRSKFDPACPNYLPPPTVTTHNGDPLPFDVLNFFKHIIHLRILNTITQCGYCHRSGHTKRSCPIRCDKCCLAGHTKEECKTRQTTITHLRKKYKDRFEAVSQRLRAEKEAAKAKAQAQAAQSNSDSSESSTSSDSAETKSSTETNNNESTKHDQKTTDDNDSDAEMEDEQTEGTTPPPHQHPHQSSENTSSSDTPTPHGTHTAEPHEPVDLPDTNTEIHSITAQPTPTINLGFNSAVSNSQSNISLSVSPSGKRELSEDSSTDNEHSTDGPPRSPRKVPKRNQVTTIEDEVEVIETDNNDADVEQEAKDNVGASEPSANSTNFIPPLQFDNLSAENDIVYDFLRQDFRFIASQFNSNLTSTSNIVSNSTTHYITDISELVSHFQEAGTEEALSPQNSFIVSSVNVQHAMRFRTSSVRDNFFNSLNNHYIRHQGNFHQAQFPVQDVRDVFFDPLLLNSSIILLQEAEFQHQASLTRLANHLASHDTFYLSSPGDPGNKSRILVNKKSGFKIWCEDVLKPAFINNLTNIEPHSYSDLLLSYGNQLFLVISLYFPSGNPNSNLNHLFQLASVLRAFNLEYNKDEYVNIVLGGDFNCVFSPEDSSNTKNSPRDFKAFLDLRDLLENSGGVYDVFRDAKVRKSTDTSPFTNNLFNKGTKRRLDQFWINQSRRYDEVQLDYAKSDTNFPGSTHQSISLRFGSSTPATDSAERPKTFTFNNILLRDTKIRTMLAEMRHFSSETALDIIPSTRLDVLLPSYIDNLQEYQTAYLRFLLLTNAEAMKSVTKSNSIRSRLIFNNPTSLNKIFKRQKSREGLHLHSNVSAGSNEVVCSEKQSRELLLAEAKTFYQDLYSADETIPPEEITSFLSTFPVRVTHNHRLKLTRAVTREEIIQSVKTLAKKKTSPGADGLTYQLISLCIEDFCPLIRDLTSSLAQTGRLPDKLSLINITLIPKKGFKISRSMEDLRPIALNSCILKIIAHIFNGRLLEVADDLIHHSQVGFLHGRKMEDLNLEYTHVYEHFLAKRNWWNLNPAPALLLLDFKKAFDLMDHHYIIEVFKTFGFPVSFVNIVKSMISGQKGRIKIDGYFSDTFELNSGVRQGNPISPTIFVLGLEPLLFFMRERLTGVALKKNLPLYRLPNFP